MDNQQLVVAAGQQPQRPVGSILVLGVGGALIGLGVVWALKEMFPQSMPS